MPVYRTINRETCHPVPDANTVEPVLSGHSRGMVLNTGLRKAP